MLDINNSTKWSLLITKKLNAPFFNENRYNSIEEQPINILMDKSLIAIFAKAHDNCPPTWKYGGKINQYVPVNILSANNINTASIKSFNIKLNQINLILPDKTLSNNYALSYTPAKWFFECELTIWEYTDNLIINETEQLKNIKDLVLNLDSKITLINSTIIPKNLYGLP